MYSSFQIVLQSVAFTFNKSTKTVITFVEKKVFALTACVSKSHVCWYLWGEEKGSVEVVIVTAV